MERKEELEILIESLKAKHENAHEVFAEAHNKMLAKAKTFFVKMLGLDENVFRVNITEQSTKITIKPVDTGFGSDITLYHYRPSGNDDREFKLSWYSTQATKADVEQLMYLEALGKVASSMRNPDGGLIPFIKGCIMEYNQNIEAKRELGCIMEYNQNIEAKRELVKKINTAQSELDKIIRNELIQSVIDNNGITMSQPINTYLFEKNGTQIVKLTIVGRTDKAFHLLAKDRRNQFHERLRVTIDDATGLFYVMAKSQKELDKSAKA